MNEIRPNGKFPPPPSLWEGNTTSEALAVSLANNEDTTFSFSPEAGELVRVALGKYTEKCDFDLLLSGYSSEEVSYNRRNGGRIDLCPTIASLWMVQPTILFELLGNQEAFERGLTARLLMFDAKAEIQEDDGTIRRFNGQNLGQWNDLIVNILTTRKGAKDPINVECKPEAREVFRQFHNESVKLQKGEFRDMEGELGRWRENAVRVALCLWVGDGAKGELTKDQAVRAVTLTKWCGFSFLEILDKERIEKKLQQVYKLHDLMIKYDGQITLRILKKNHSFDPDHIKRLAIEFPEYLKVDSVKPKTGRPSEILKIPD